MTKAPGECPALWFFIMKSSHHGVVLRLNQNWRADIQKDIGELEHLQLKIR
jgi:hypothetical protein